MKKSGKEKMSYYRELDQDDQDLDLKSLRKRESVLDYFDDPDDDFKEDTWIDDEEESLSEEQWDEGDEDWDE